jgi:diguanylate cyclase (GGDEF)-like protein
MESFPDEQQAVGLYGGERYALQTHLDASSPDDALVTAVATWCAAVGRLGLPGWHLARAEVMTQQEFEDDRTMPGGAEYLAGDDLLKRALHDPLTGLVNAELFADHVRGAVDGLPSTSGQVVVLRADLDHFGSVNRSDGYAFGDRMLVELSARLWAGLPGAAAVARVGGDEFAVVLTNATDCEAARVAALVVDALRASVDIEGRVASTTASVGLALTSHVTGPDELIRRAGLAMCLAKEAGGDCWRTYRPGVPVDGRRVDGLPEAVPDRMAQVVLLQTVATAANEHASLRDAAPAVLREVCSLTGWTLGHVSLCDASTGRAEPTGLWHVQGPDCHPHFRAARERRAFGPGEELVAKVLATGRPASTYDLDQPDPDHPSGDRDWDDPVAGTASSAGIRSAFAFPVLVSTQVVAVLEFYSGRAQAPEASLQEVMASVGVQLGRVVEREEARAAMTRSGS